MLRHLDGKCAHSEQLVDVLLWNLAGAIDLIRVDIVAQIAPELSEKFLARRDIFGALFWIRKNPVEIEPADEKIARETAAFVERIARTLRQLEGGRFARRHFRGVDHRRDCCWLRRRFFGYLFFRCFER